VEGENLAKIAVANSEAQRRIKEAEALRLATAAENVQKAKSLEESYFAEQAAESARAEKERATRVADIVVAAEIDKKRVEIEAEAGAERERRRAKGEADGILFLKQAQAQGDFEILSKQAEGFTTLVKAAANDPSQAVLLLVADKLPELVKTQVEAIKNIKIDKVTVWDPAGGSADGSSATASFLSGLMKSLPPLDDLFRMAGMELPSYLKGEAKPEEPTKAKAKAKAVPPAPKKAAPPQDEAKADQA
jgi:flotillin